MPRRLISSAGRAVLALVGFVWGVSRSLGAPRESDRESPPSGSLRFGEMERRLARMESSVERLGSARARRPLQQPQNGTEAAGSDRVDGDAGTQSAADYITRQQLAEALDRMEKRLETSFSDRLSHQTEAIGALNEMVRNTDTLLERVLDRLESLTDAGEDENRLAKTAGAR